MLLHDCLITVVVLHDYGETEKGEQPTKNHPPRTTPTKRVCSVRCAALLTLIDLSTIWQLQDTMEKDLESYKAGFLFSETITFEVSAASELFFLAS